MDGSKDIFNLTEFQRLQEIEQRRAGIAEHIERGEFATSEIRTAYEAALVHLGESAVALARTPELQISYARHGLEAVHGLEQLAPLKDILPEDQIKPIETDLRARIASTREFFAAYGTHTPEAEDFSAKISPEELALANTVEILPTADNVPSKKSLIEHGLATAEAHETVRVPVEIILSDKAIFLGRRKKMVPLSKKHHDGQADYSDVRRRALKAIINNQGEPLKVNDLWEMMYDKPPKSIDRNVMVSVRAWLLGLTYNRRPLIAFNGKRGSGSAYGVSSGFELKLVEGRKEKRAIEEIDSPMTAGDLYLTARHLEQFNFVLRKRGFPEIEPKIVKGLERFKPDYSHIKGDAEAIRQSRIEAITRVDKFMRDQDRMYDFIEHSDMTSADYKFVEFLFGLEEDQLELIKSLIACRVERVPMADGHYRIEAINEKDGIVAWSDPFDTTASDLSEIPASEHPTEDETKEKAAGKTEVIEDDSVGSEAVTDAGERTAVLPVKNKSTTETINGRRFSETELAKLSLFEKIAYDAAATLLEHLSPAETYTRQHIQNFFPKFSANRVATAKDNRIIPKTRHMKFTIEQVVRVIVYTDRDLQNIYRNRKYKQVVEDILSRAIKKATESAERALAGEG